MWDALAWRGHQSSFVQPVVPPDVEPDASPLVCFSINADWLPYVVGAMMQLAQPSAWDTSDAGVLQTTLFRVMGLIDQVGSAVACEGVTPMQLRVNNCQLQSSTDGGTTWTEIDGWESYQSLCLPLVSMKVGDGCQLAFSVDGGTTWQGVAGWDEYQASCLPKQLQTRFTDACELQTSSDGGTTWATVPGWDTNLSACFSSWLTGAGGVTIPTQPINPGNLSADNEACAVASYLANDFIKISLTQAVNSLEGNIGKAGLLLGLAQAIPGVDVVLDLLAFGAVGLYSAISGGTIGNYQSALADPSLWSAMTCAIYNAIKSVGYVDADNYSAVLTAVGGVTYTHSEVVSTIHDYVAGIGLKGIQQVQSAGALDTGDCSACGGAWCYEWDFTVSDGGWAISSGDAVYTGAGWQSVHEAYHNWTVCNILLNFASTPLVDTVEVFFNANMETGSCSDRRTYSGVSPEREHYLMITSDTCASTVGGDINASANVESPTDHIQVTLIAPYSADYLFTISKIRAHGTGTCPFGTPNCTWGS